MPRVGSVSMNREINRNRPRIVRPEDENRRADNSDGEVSGLPPKRRDRVAQQDAKEAGVESLPDGEDAAARESAKSRDD